jgi:hypothetical protein
VYRNAAALNSLSTNFTAIGGKLNGTTMTIPMVSSVAASGETHETIDKYVSWFVSADGVVQEVTFISENALHFNMH